MKFMNLKRFASIVMAGVMTLSLAVPAFAATTTTDPNTTKIEGKYEEVPIAVSVPTTGTASINPYGLPVSISLGEEATANLVGQQITTRPLNIKNQGDVTLDVNASLAVTPKGDVVIAAAKGANEAATCKDIKVDLEVVGLNDTALAVSNESETLENLLNAKFADKDTWKTGVKTLAAPNAAKTTAPTAPATSGSTLAVLGAVTKSGDGGYTYAKNSIALFRLTGELNEEPKSAATTEAPWAPTDGFTATIVFKFTPHVLVDASISVPSTLALTSATSPATVTATFNAGETNLTVDSYAWSSDSAAVCTAAGTTATGAVTFIGAGTTNVTCTATLSDGTSRTATCAVTCS